MPPLGGGIMGSCWEHWEGSCGTFLPMASLIMFRCSRRSAGSSADPKAGALLTATTSSSGPAPVSLPGLVDGSFPFSSLPCDRHVVKARHAPGSKLAGGGKFHLQLGMINILYYAFGGYVPADVLLIAALLQS